VEQVSAKTVITVFNITQGMRVEARQTSDVNIKSLKFTPFDSQLLVSCGSENIRFWRIRTEGNISPGPVKLGSQNSRNADFLSLDFAFDSDF